MARKTNDYTNYKPKYGTIEYKNIVPKKWKYNDPRDQCINQVFMQAKAQTDYRYKHKFNPGQWKLTFDEYKEIWGDKFEQRGRKVGEYCFTRINSELDWTADNCEVIIREEQGRKAVEHTWEKRYEKMANTNSSDSNS